MPSWFPIMSYSQLFQGSMALAGLFQDMVGGKRHVRLMLKLMVSQLGISSMHFGFRLQPYYNPLERWWQMQLSLNLGQMATSSYKYWYVAMWEALIPIGPFPNPWEEWESNMVMGKADGC